MDIFTSQQLEFPGSKKDMSIEEQTCKHMGVSKNRGTP